MEPVEPSASADQQWWVWRLLLLCMGKGGEHLGDGPCPPALSRYAAAKGEGGRGKPAPAERSERGKSGAKRNEAVGRQAVRPAEPTRPPPGRMVGLSLFGDATASGADEPPKGGYSRLTWAAGQTNVRPRA